MSDLASLTVIIDRAIKKDADYIANAMGMTLSTANKVHTANNEAAQFHQLLDDMRADATERGFMSDGEINAEIQATRTEMKA